jgi:hypothetical protein
VEENQLFDEWTFFGDRDESFGLLLSGRNKPRVWIISSLP